MLLVVKSLLRKLQAKRSSMTHRQEMKILSIVVKYLPPFMALMYFINSICSLRLIYNSTITFTCSCGFLPLLLIYLCCRVLKYCIQYKAYLGYIAVNNIINWLDYEYGFTEDVRIGWIIVVGAFFCLISYLMYIHIRSGKAIL